MERVRVLATYLPQYHNVKENNIWWGEGFTDWVAVKKANKLYDGHYQPHTPLNNNYYDLLSKETLQWQASLAKEYLVDGFVFYHYWFKNGRKILEKPAELLLNNKDINMPFCFCWATVTWARTWSNIKGSNSWADKFENKSEEQNGKGKSILLEQQYGGIQEWEKHFQYLLPFFKDDRYISHAGCPVFIFDESEKMPCQERMILYWKKRAREEGLPGLYIITMITGVRLQKIADAKIDAMGLAYNKSVKKESSLNFYDYDELWRTYLAKPISESMITLLWGMVGFDDSPRRGENGRIIKGNAPEKFKKYFGLLMEKSASCNAPFVFLNAWNEWGEGMHLEPDERYQYAYLEAVKDVVQEYYQSITDTKRNAKEADALKNVKKYYDNAFFSEMEEKMNGYVVGYNLMRQWMQMREKKGALKSWLNSHINPIIAIYGWSVDGKRIHDELIENGANVAYIVDDSSQARNDVSSSSIYSSGDELPACDLMIVPSMRDYSDVLLNLSEKYTFPVISLYEFLYDVCATK